MKRQAKKKSTVTGSIRVIAGQWRGRKLPVLDAQGLRPTTDRTKETLFNWLAPYIAGTRCLDAFAGSGGLGFESLSRHANHVTFVEYNKSAALQIEANCQLLKLNASQAQVINNDVLQHLNQPTEAYDLIFADPPFNKQLLPELIAKIEQQQLLAPNGLIYIESEISCAYSIPAQWQLLKQKQTKQVNYRLYQQGE
ncbi:16S rRNA (guanine(966)-N(2))-methyltransferase RsmD [Neptunicella marina]|uniref:Ribosomal RNA small subunit methyltransferase D n=1 Tax=Neptunicella marina TaxID=2125989 RepID=A0A8J6IUS6_9ALTE|nr:16S rRNA (guanine(966)-N(2))-methyltransferase RsmD [Neptunicella marina]MBC3766016.1 16S rRNA (guanine(966)-N(2))-methyltransferase RsmD [Neptunicella marina]